MKKLLWIGSPIFLLMPVLAMAQSDFDGTWKIDLNTAAAMPDKPDVLLLQGGNYHCKSCVPVVNVKADGEDHSVTGNPYYECGERRCAGEGR
jgi:hypothetical protein